MLNIKKLLARILTLVLDKKLTSPDSVHLFVQLERTSFNTPEGTGVWYIGGATNASPTGAAAWGMLFQMRSPYSVHPTSSTAMYAQLFIDNTGKAYTRMLNNYSWSSWREL